MTSLSPTQPGPASLELSPEEKRIFPQLFKIADSANVGVITGEAAKRFLTRSNLSPAILAEIWQIADSDNDGFLNQYRFYVALRLIGKVQRGAPLARALSDSPGPIPKFEGIKLEGPPPAPAPMGHSRVPQLSSADRQKFMKLFDRTSVDGVIPGDQAREIFVKAKLPNETLGQIWNLTDVQQRGFLEQTEFVCAMHLIHCILNGSLKSLPHTLPQSLFDAAAGKPRTSRSAGTSSSAAAASAATTPRTGQAPPPPPAPHVNRSSSLNNGPSSPSVQNAGPKKSDPNTWILKDKDKQRFDGIFKSLDKKNAKELGANEIVPFLTTSKLPEDTLATIWDLSDIHKNGMFDKAAFAIALLLVQKALAGYELPKELPPQLLPKPTEAVTSGPPSAALASPANGMNTASPLSPPPNKPPQQQSSLLDLFDLNDAFASPPLVESPRKPSVETKSAASDRPTPTATSPTLATVGPLPGSRKAFVPTSSFGQSIQKQFAGQVSDSVSPPNETPSLVASPAPDNQATKPAVSQDSVSSPIRMRSPPVAPIPRVPTQLQSQTLPSQPASQSISPSPASGLNSPQNSLPPTQSKSFSPAVPTSVVLPSVRPIAVSQPQAPQPRPTMQNDDLLVGGDSEAAMKLSQESTELGNLSNQVSSLTSQTQKLADKKSRAEEELEKIISTKNVIQSKLIELRASYDKEVTNVKEVEETLRQSQTETEQLRQEHSILEVNYHDVQSQYQTFSTELAADREENNALKDKIKFFNAEIQRLKTELESMQKETRQQKAIVSINDQQVSTLEQERDKLSESIRSLQEGSEEVDHEAASLSKPESVTSIPALAGNKSVAAPPLVSRSSSGINPFHRTPVVPGFESQPPLAMEDQESNGVSSQVSGVSTAAGANDQVSAEAPKEIAEAVTIVPHHERGSVGSDSLFERTVPSSVSQGPPTTAADEITSAEATPVPIAERSESITSTPIEQPTNEGLTSTAAHNGHYYSDESDEDGDHFVDAIGSVPGGLPGESSGFANSETNVSSGLPTRESSTVSATPPVPVATTVVAAVSSSDSEPGDEGSPSDEETSPVNSRQPESPTVTSEAVRETPPATQVSTVTAPTVAANTAKELPPHPPTYDEVMSSTSTSTAQSSTQAVNATAAAVEGQSGNVLGSRADQAARPLGTSLEATVPPQRRIDDEFPPIQELSLSETSSSEDEGENMARRDDQNGFNDSFVPGSSTGPNQGAPEFSEQTTESSSPFDAFEGLKEAKVSTGNDLDEFNDSFNDFGEPSSQPSRHKSSGSALFGSQPNTDLDNITASSQPNQEWEDLFAGFDSGQTVPPSADNGAPASERSSSLVGPLESPSSPQSNYLPFNLPPRAPAQQKPNLTRETSFSRVSHPKSTAVTNLETQISKLVGMGFSRENSIKALEKNNFDLNNATNYLLDHPL